MSETPGMASHRLSRDQVIWSFGPDLRAVLEIEPGDVVTFETNDCFSGQIRSEDDLVTDIDLGRINSATGPVAVRGAEPGDSLVVEILDVRPIEWGVATLIPGFGQLDHRVQAPLTRLFEVRDGIVRMNERVSFPAKPMVGVVGVATASETLTTGKGRSARRESRRPLARQGCADLLPRPAAGRHVRGRRHARGDGRR
jgi:amidase